MDESSEKRGKKKTKIVLALVVLVALVAAGALGFFAWKQKQTQKREQAAAKEAIEKAEAAKRAKITALLKEAETALQQTNFSASADAVTRILSTDPQNKQAAEMLARVRREQDLAEATPVKIEVEALWATVAGIDRGQGIGDSLDTADAVVKEARNLFETQLFLDAKRKYEEAVPLCREILKRQEERSQAVVRRTAADKAKEAAAAVKASDDASDLWKLASKLGDDAASLFEKGTFGDAAGRWQMATTEYCNARTWAEGVQAVRAVKTQYMDTLAAATADFLAKYAPDPWAATIQVQQGADALAAQGKWAEAVVRWNEANTGLAATIQHAKIAQEEERKRIEHERMMAAFGAALGKAQAELAAAKQMPKTDFNGMQRVKAGLESVQGAMTSDWYGRLQEVDQTRLLDVKWRLEVEGFHFRFPDLEEVPGVKFASIERLAPGSREARERQKAAVANLLMPLEVRSRKTGIRMRLVPAGTFLMGAGPEDKPGQDEKPRHEVTITRPFYMGLYEVSQAEWERLGMKNKSFFKNVGAQAPVETISWKEAQDFCRKLCATENVATQAYRLPTEAEWEYACRAGTATPYATGTTDNDMLNAGWQRKNSVETVHPVGQKIPNAWGLFDMHGNVWEFCQDYPRVYGEAPLQDPNGGNADQVVTIRGGGWDDEEPLNCRSANRGTAQIKFKSYEIGCRIVRELVPVEAAAPSVQSPAEGQPPAAKQP